MKHSVIKIIGCSQKQGNFDLSPVDKTIAEMEKQGYEVKQIQPSFGEYGIPHYLSILFQSSEGKGEPK